MGPREPCPLGTTRQSDRRWRRAAADNRPIPAAAGGFILRVGPRGHLRRERRGTQHEGNPMIVKDAKTRRAAALRTRTDLGAEASRDISGALNTLLADLFALYLKTKNFHWHVSGPHFRDYHLLLDEQATEIFSTTDSIAERGRKIGGPTHRFTGHIARPHRAQDTEAT